MNQVLPKQADNTFRGHTAALWILGAVVLLRMGAGLTAIFNGRLAATTADGIPLDSYGPDGAQTVLALSGLLGLARVMNSVLAFLVLARYRALVPLVFVVLLLEQAARRVVLYYTPIVRDGATPVSAINIVLLAAMVLGLALSLWTSAKHRSSSAH